MTNPTTVRLDETTLRRLDELAQCYPSRTAAVVDAINKAWQELHEAKLAAAYDAVAAENPHYPYESAEERDAMRARRAARLQRLADEEPDA
ncbi:putative antitoxin MazE4 [Longimycelium tulufanense]|uniref:Putative antitoxin MazE4 n=1 Tax=Longimycelium tulufanense TaxID=907463 RepID=A0A8J3FSE7_9PSEU|nr:antitoxin [Longimycelium tulufanense]GGM34627.1 putative antitoxin MazE4 [Longimycelium tulufanense]